MKDKTVVITGGSSGIGKSSALQFAENGARVLITGRRPAELEKVANMNENITAFVADSADPLSAELIVNEAISLWGRLDILVNNAGAGTFTPIESITEKQITDVFSVNVVGTSLLTAAAIPYLREAKGSIINVSSTIGHKPAAGLSHYGASKAALDHLTKAWALELAPLIRVNAVAAGPTESGALTGFMGFSEAQAKEIKEQEKEGIPLKRRGVPEDISYWVTSLADPSTAWVTGQVIGVDGGFGI